MFRMRLKQLRMDFGYSQEALAYKLGVSQSAVGSWESGVRVPKFSTLQKLADFFQVSVDYLLGRDIIDDSERADDDDLTEIIIRGRDGSVTAKNFTPEQMIIINKILDALTEENNPDL